RLSVERIFNTRDFASDAFGPSRWLNDSTYTTTEPGPNGTGSTLVAVDAASGRQTTLVSAAMLTPPGKPPLEIEDYSWSDDHSRLLIFTNTARVWRANTR